jgi:hypothetical protein
MEQDRMTFAELMEQSVIFQGILTLAITGAWVYMMVQQLPVPPELHAAAGIVMGFFFGSKQSIFAKNEARKMDAKRRLIEAERV